MIALRFEVRQKRVKQKLALYDCNDIFFERFSLGDFFERILNFSKERGLFESHDHPITKPLENTGSIGELCGDIR